MEAEGIDPLDIDKVVITHAHPNRIGGALDESGEPAFPNADYFLSQDELSFLASDAATMKMLDPTVDELLTNEVRLHLFALRDQLTRFDGDYEIVPGIKAIVAPGHTPGHVVLSVGSDGEQLLHVSDVLLHPLHLKHPEWTPVFDTSPEEAAASKRWVFDRAAEEGALVFANHLPPFPNLGHIVKGGEGWQWYPIENRG